MKHYWTIKNVKESGVIVMEYVATSEKKAIAFLKKQFQAEYFGADIMGVKKPIDTTDDGFFFYNGNENRKGGEWKVEMANAAF